MTGTACRHGAMALRSPRRRATEDREDWSVYSRSRRRVSPLAGLLVLPFFLIPGVVVAAVLARVLAAQGDVTGRLGLPAAAERFLQRDSVAYPLHAALGATLNGLGGPPTAAGVQWLKAAAHAVSDAQLERAVQGVGEAAARDGDGARVRAAVCPRLARIVEQRTSKMTVSPPAPRAPPCSST